MVKLALKVVGFLAAYAVAHLAAHGLGRLLPDIINPAHLTGWWGGTAFVLFWPRLFGFTPVAKPTP